MRARQAVELRQEACKLAESHPGRALAIARSIGHPWYRAQALAWIARYSEDNVIKLATESAQSASACEDAYQQSAVRAWEIAALSERGYLTEGRLALHEALETCRQVKPLSSRAECLIGLLQAATRIGRKEAELIRDEILASCSEDTHWRCRRAVRDAPHLACQSASSREYFW